ncbi:MAG: HpaII family restriction endonuclease [Flavobacteriales bacterium]|nr:HpaII family restriction endonuclease [Flavobacteriales bacterium]
MLKGNKGEWSEIYTLLKLLGDKKVYVGDKDLNKIPNLLYPIIKILRDEKNGSIEYSVNDEIKIIQGDKELLSISIDDFKDKAKFLLSEIKENSKTFEVPEIEKFLSQIKCSSLKAKSSVKTDIRIVIHDLKTNMHPVLGFSIKSQLGSPSTLLNAGKTTNFIYKISGLITDSQVENINSINGTGKIKERLIAIENNNCKIQFNNLEKDIFKNNLVLIDSLLPKLIAEIIKEFYSSKKSKIIDLTNEVAYNNPLNFDITHEHKYYEYKLKKFLTEVAVGMMPATVWTGVYDATGGYLVVKEDGDILAYHLYNRNEFEDYLFHNTKLDTASSSRHSFGKIYKENGEFYIKLNLQIRFLK